MTFSRDFGRISIIGSPGFRQDRDIPSPGIPSKCGDSPFDPYPPLRRTFRLSVSNGLNSTFSLRQLKFLDAFLSPAEKRRVTFLASTICQITPKEQGELWRKYNLHVQQYQIHGQELLQNYKFQADASIPNLESQGAQDFLKALVQKGGGHPGFLRTVLDGDLTKILPAGQTIAGTTPNAQTKPVPEEKKEEKTSFNVVIKSFTQESKLKLIKEVKTMLNIGLKEAKEQVEAALKAPVTLYKNIAKLDAEAKVKKLKETGAEIVLE